MMLLFPSDDRCRLAVRLADLARRGLLIGRHPGSTKAGSTLAVPNAGKILGGSGSRIIQIGLKYMF